MDIVFLPADLAPAVLVAGGRVAVAAPRGAYIDSCHMFSSLVFCIIKAARMDGFLP